MYVCEESICMKSVTQYLRRPRKSDSERNESTSPCCEFNFKLVLFKTNFVCAKLRFVKAFAVNVRGFE